MKVFKFGGASVKNASAVKNVSNILSLYKNEKIIVVVSAMGKTTNLLEKAFESYQQNNKIEYDSLINQFKTFHQEIAENLFFEQKNAILNQLECLTKELSDYYNNKEKASSKDYSHIVSFGELISSKILSHYLLYNGKSSCWCDAKSIIQTSKKHEDSSVIWNDTQKKYNQYIPELFKSHSVIVTQGFIGKNSMNETTTLGREGSDFSAAIFAYCGDAQGVYIWKDVPGMLNADPKFFKNTIKLDQISFREALELSYYGASVIHPKTIKPLHNKGIPLYVKSFLSPQKDGTIIHSSKEKDKLIPSFIFKHNQILFSIRPKDFSFLVEKNLSDIFSRLAKINAKINVMQNSALSFSILLDHKKINLNQVLSTFEDDYQIRYNEGLELVTIRHYDQKTIDFVTKGKKNILEQKTRHTIRIVLKNYTH